MRSHQMLAAMGLVATLPLATPFARAANAQTYTQTLTFGPIKMSYSDLANIIARTQRFVATARDSGTAVFRNTVGVSDGRASMSANGSMSSTTFLNAPPIAYTASFSYAADRGRIAQVELSLSDYERKATISGTSSEDVDALAALLSRDMSAFGTTFGGEGFRNAAGMILFVIPIVIGVSFFASKRPPGWVALIAQGLAYILLFLPPWEHWLPGTAIYSGDASFAVRYAPQIGLWSLILAALSIPVGILVTRRQPPVERSAAPPPASGAE